MSDFKVFDIAGSGMSAHSMRLNATASNLANANSISSSIDQTYRARHPVFAAVQHDVLSKDQDMGVKVLGVVESQAPIIPQYRPEHPQADKDGNIFMPNVNVVEEMANMISASRSYQMNVEVARTAKDLMQRTLTLGQ